MVCCGDRPQTLSVLVGQEAPELLPLSEVLMSQHGVIICVRVAVNTCGYEMSWTCCGSLNVSFKKILHFFVPSVSKHWVETHRWATSEALLYEIFVINCCLTKVKMIWNINIISPAVRPGIAPHDTRGPRAPLFKMYLVVTNLFFRIVVNKKNT